MVLDFLRSFRLKYVLNSYQRLSVNLKNRFSVHWIAHVKECCHGGHIHIAEIKLKTIVLDNGSYHQCVYNQGTPLFPNNNNCWIILYQQFLLCRYSWDSEVFRIALPLQTEWWGTDTISIVWEENSFFYWKRAPAECIFNWL